MVRSNESGQLLYINDGEDTSIQNLLKPKTPYRKSLKSQRIPLLKQLNMVCKFLQGKIN